MKDFTSNTVSIPIELKILGKINFLFFWVKYFYPNFRGLKSFYLFFYFFPQKIIGINRLVPWPVHFTSKILYHKKISVGINSAPGLSNGCYIQARNGIMIGNNFRMGPGSGLISANHDISDYDKWTKGDPIIIGDNVWLGMNVVVAPGVCIGDNVIIGANSFVSKSIPSNSIAVGSPCRVIKNKPPYTGITYES